MKKILVVIILATSLFGLKLFSKKIPTRIPGSADNSASLRLEKELADLKKFILLNPKYNADIAFFIDMKIPSSRNRFFIYDLKNDLVIDQGLVAHGSGSETGKEGELHFSNTNNSLCTSLGKFQIGHSYTGKFGKAYKLYGLDKSNSNAYLRNIVLHKFGEVPYDEQSEPICNSHGCPMVNHKFYTRIEKILDASQSDVILDIYY